MTQVDLDSAPIGIQQLDTYKGFPIPYTTAYRGDVPDFKVTDPEKWARVVKQKLCGVCGMPLLPPPLPMAFIGGPRSIQGRVFFDPAMHKTCAEWAAKTCPFIAGEKDYSPLTAGMVTQFEAAKRPPVMCLGLTDGYTIQKLPDGNVVVVANPWSEVVMLDEGEG